MVSCTLRCSFEPPTALLRAKLGLPQSALVPPHGPAFCGSPRSFSTIHDAGSTSLKWAKAALDAATISPATTSTNREDCFTSKLLSASPKRVAPSRDQRRVIRNRQLGLGS